MSYRLEFMGKRIARFLCTVPSSPFSLVRSMLWYHSRTSSLACTAKVQRADVGESAWTIVENQDSCK